MSQAATFGQRTNSLINRNNRQQRTLKQEPRGRNNFTDENASFGKKIVRKVCTEIKNKFLDERRRSQGTADSNQLFLGNLPHNATEEDLREIFSQFGNIVDLRIHNKPTKVVMQGSRATPNYGFITYETQQEVQNCLSAKVGKINFFLNKIKSDSVLFQPIYFPLNDKNGTVLNVEEKKAKDRSNYVSGGTRVSSDNNVGSKSRENGQRRGVSGLSANRGGTVNSGSGGVGGNKSNSFNRGGPQTRGSNNTYSRR